MNSNILIIGLIIIVAVIYFTQNKNLKYRYNKRLYRNRCNCNRQRCNCNRKRCNCNRKCNCNRQSIFN
jgi:hypothetical protein